MNKCDFIKYNIPGEYIKSIAKLVIINFFINIILIYTISKYYYNFKQFVNILHKILLLTLKYYIIIMLLK